MKPFAITVFTLVLFGAVGWGVCRVMDAVDRITRDPVFAEALLKSLPATKHCPCCKCKECHCE